MKKSDLWLIPALVILVVLYLIPGPDTARLEAIGTRVKLLAPTRTPTATPTAKWAESNPDETIVWPTTDPDAPTIVWLEPSPDWPVDPTYEGPPPGHEGTPTAAPVYTRTPAPTPSGPATITPSRQRW